MNSELRKIDLPLHSDNDPLIADCEGLPSHRASPDLLDSTIQSKMTPTFLGLPPAIRKQIYRHAGLVKPFPISLDKTHSITLEGYDIPLPGQLLFVCRTIHNEAIDIYYSENHFVVGLTVEEDGAPFLNLHRAVRKAMTSLTIGFGRWWWATSMDCPRKYVVDSKEEMVGKIDREGEFNENLRHLKTIISQLVADVQESQLGLSIIFPGYPDEQGIKEAQSIMMAVEALSELKNCALHFEWLPIPHLTKLAQETVLKVITPRPVETYGPFQFLKLPLEIQLQVLSYTDLVCPNDIKFKVNSFIHKSEYCCGNCNDAFFQCYCPPNTVGTSWDCTCWRYPKAFFLVSHGVCNLATEIFYSRNTFQIHMDCNFADHQRDQNYLDFLEGIPSNSLQFLRSLHLVFWIWPLCADPEGHYCEENMVDPDEALKADAMEMGSDNSAKYPGDTESFERVIYVSPFDEEDTSPNMTEKDNTGGEISRRKVDDYRVRDERDWEEAFQFMAQNLDLPRLTLRLTDDCDKWDLWDDLQDPDVARGCRRELKYYRMVFWKVRRLKDRGLRKLFIHLPCRQGYNGPRNRLEDGLEKMVMGEEYDGVKEGKFNTDPDGTPKYRLWY